MGLVSVPLREEESTPPMLEEWGAVLQLVEIDQKLTHMYSGAVDFCEATVRLPGCFPRSDYDHQHSSMVKHGWLSASITLKQFRQDWTTKCHSCFQPLSLTQSGSIALLKKIANKAWLTEQVQCCHANALFLFPFLHIDIPNILHFHDCFRRLLWNPRQ